jgi:DtxR family manganese transport transcriptional regulator
VPNSHRFERTRNDHAEETAADYVELIQDLIAERGEARAADIASHLGVSHVTVSKTIQRLQRDGLVTSQPYRSIFLTEKGRDLAERMRAKHQTVLDFLRALGVSEKVAETDAEGIEHHVSEETLDAMERFLSVAQRGGR